MENVLNIFIENELNSLFLIVYEATHKDDFI